MSTKSIFATAVLQILAKERRTAHRKCWNNVKEPQLFQVRDVVKDYVQVQPKFDTVEVKKLSYQARRPFQIKSVLGNNSDEVQIYN